MADSVKSPFEEWSDGRVVDEHTRQGTNSYLVSEMLRRLMGRLAAQAKSADALTGRIWWLNVWLVVLTFVLVVLTAAQGYIAFAMWKGIK